MAKKKSEVKSCTPLEKRTKQRLENTLEEDDNSELWGDGTPHKLHPLI